MVGCNGGARARHGDVQNWIIRRRRPRNTRCISIATLSFEKASTDTIDRVGNFIGMEMSSDSIVDEYADDDELILYWISMKRC